MMLCEILDFFFFISRFSVLIFIDLIGETDDISIKSLRSRQMKNFHLALMTSQVNIFESLFILLSVCLGSLFDVSFLC